MRDFQSGRRHFLRLMISVPVAVSVGLDPDVIMAEVEKAATSPEDSLRKLIHLLGPWSEAETEKADDFAGRFLKHASGPYLPGSAGLVKSIAGRFSSGAAAPDTLNLEGVPPEDRRLLMNLLTKIYTLVEVRFHVSGEPPPGECQADRLRYTRPPA